MQIDYQDETNEVTEEQLELVDRLLKFAAQYEKLEGNYELSITFTTDEEIQVINREYRGIDRPTDVISFALEEEGEGEITFERMEEMPILLGDLIISLDTMRRQAVEYNHEEKRELGFLALHGFLHLLGYDHMTEEDEKEMFRRQDEILQAFGLTR